MVADGLIKAIRCSLRFLLENTDSKNDIFPLFESSLELQQTDVIYIPSLDFGVADGYYDLIDSLMGDIFRQSSLIPRLSAHTGQENYQSDMEAMDDLVDMRNEIMDRINTIMTKAMEHRNSFDNYAYLWVDDRSEFMRQFLLYGHVLTQEEIDSDEGVLRKPPTLAQFKVQVVITCLLLLIIIGNIILSKQWLLTTAYFAICIFCIMLACAKRMNSDFFFKMHFIDSETNQ